MIPDDERGVNSHREDSNRKGAELHQPGVRRQRSRLHQLMATLASCCILVKLPQSLAVMFSAYRIVQREVERRAVVFFTGISHRNCHYSCSLFAIKHNICHNMAKWHNDFISFRIRRLLGTSGMAIFS